MRPTGYLRDPPSHRRTPFRHLAARLGSTELPSAATMAEFLPPVLDQNTTSSCTGGSTACAIATALAAAGTPLAWVPSPKGIYGNGRAVDRVADINGALPPLTDQGAQPSQVMRALSEFGVRKMRGPTTGGSNYDCDSSNVNDEVTVPELEEEATTIVVGDYGIYSDGAQRITDLKVALARKKPVTGAIAGGSSAFQNYSGGILGPLGSDLDHYIFLYGYVTESDGFTTFIGRNTWTENWGENGNFRLSEAAVLELGDLVALDVKIGSAQ